MADGGFEQLLMQFGLDLSPFQTASETIKATLAELNNMAAQVEESASRAAASQGAALASVTTTGEAATAAATEAVVAQKIGSDEIQKQIALIQAQVEQRRLETAEVDKTTAASNASAAATKAETAEEQLKLAALRLQTAELAKQRAEKREGGGAGAEGVTGAVGTALGDVTKGALGGGLAGQVAGGVLAGAGIVAIIEAAGQAVERFIDKLKDVSTESGSIVSLEHAFQILATGAGVDATKMMSDLSSATEGLVSKLSLLKLSTAALRAPYHITSQAVIELSESVVALAESSGHTAEQGIEALTQSLLRGRTYMLASVTGVAALRDVTKDIPTIMGPAAKATLEWQRALVLLQAQAEKLSPLPPTLEKISTQLKVAGENLMLSFGEGLNQSEGIVRLEKTLGLVESRFGSLSNTAARFGDAVAKRLADAADAAVWLGQHLSDVKEVVIVLAAWLAALFVGPKITALAVAFDAVTTAIRAATGATVAMSAAQKELLATNLLLAALTAVFYGLFKFFQQAKSEVEEATGLTVTWGDVLHGTLTTVKNDLTLVYAILKDMIEAAMGNPFALWRIPKDIEDFKAGAKDIDKGIAREAMMRTAGTVSGHGYSTTMTSGEVGDYMDKVNRQNMEKPTKQPGDQETLAQQNKDAQARRAMLMAQAKAELEDKKAAIADEKALDDQAYAEGEESLAEHEKKMLAIAAETRDAQKEEAGQALDIAVNLIRDHLATGSVSQKQANYEMQTAEAQYHAATVAADAKFEAARSKIQLDGIRQREAAAIAVAHAQEQRVQEQQRAAQQKSTKQEQEGIITPDDFFTQRIDQIQAVADAQIAAANTVFQNSANNQKSLETRAAAIEKALQGASNQMDALMDAQAQLDLRSLQHRFQPQEAALQSQLQAYQEQQQQGSNVPVTGTLEELQGNLKEQLLSYQNLLDNLTQSGQQFSDTWWQTYQRMESVYGLMVKYNEELQKSKDYSQPLGEIFQSLDNIAGLWTSKWAKNFTEVFGQGIKALEASSGRRDTLMNAMGQGPAIQKTPQQIAFEAAANSTQARLHDTGDATGQLGVAFMSLRDQVMAVAEAMGLLTGRAAVPPDQVNPHLDVDNPDSIEGPVTTPALPTLPAPVMPVVLGPAGQVAPTPTTFPETPQNQTVAHRAPYVSPVEEASPAAASSVTQLGTAAMAAVDGLGRFADKLTSLPADKSANVATGARPSDSVPIPVVINQATTPTSPIAAPVVVKAMESSNAPRPSYVPTAEPSQAIAQGATQTASALAQLTTGVGGAITALGQFANKLTQPYTPTVIPSPSLPGPQLVQPTATLPSVQPVTTPNAALTPSTSTATDSVSRLGIAADATVTALMQFEQKLVTPLVAQSVTVHATSPSDKLEPETPNLTSTVPTQPPVPMPALPALPATTGNGGPNPNDTMESWVKGLTAGVAALTDFVSAVTRSKSAITGAIAGGTSGAGAGNVAGGALTAGSKNLADSGGALGGLGSLMGSVAPFAGAIGAVLGSVVGAIVGQKNAQIADEVSGLSSQYSGIMESFAQNTDNLNATITKLQQLILQAQEDEANSKKGGSQFASMISQYSQELDSLTNQASTLMSQMETQLAIFETPSGMQSFLSNLQQIIEQYDKFAGAAQGASQLAQANSWLADSLSNFTDSLQNTYNSDEESAIGDALSLNQLLSERSTIMSNLNNQVVGILEQGVLTRQQTTAMTKGQQIEQAETGVTDQLSTIDQQISLEQYKVSVEQYIFNLATTKVGLETQLLQLQEQQSSQSLAQIQALQQLINTLQSGSFNFTTLQSLLNALGYSGAAGLIPPSTLQTPGSAATQPSQAQTSLPTTPNAANWDAIGSAAYQSRASLGYGNFRGSNL